MSFIGITAYWIDKHWQLRESLIGFKHLTSVYSGIKLTKILTQVLDKYGIINQISTLTTDNASNNKTLNKELNKLVSLIKSGQNILG